MSMFLSPSKLYDPTDNGSRLAALPYIFLAVFLFYPETAMAATFGQLLCNARLVGSGYSRVLGAAAYIIGLFLIVRGVFLAKRHAENPNDSQVTKAVAHMFGGGAVASLPAAAGVLQRSIFGAGSGAGSFGCTPGAVGAATALDVMMQNFVRNIYAPMFSLLSVLSVVIGVTFIVKGLLRGAKTGTNPQAADPKVIITNLVVGAVLISMASALPSVLRTLFGTGVGVSNVTSYTGIQWSSLVGSGVDVTAANNTTRALLAFIQIIGGISFLRGWLLVKTAMEGGQATVPQGITHIVGGAMAINIDLMINLLDDTFGTGVIA